MPKYFAIKRLISLLGSLKLPPPNWELRLPKVVKYINFLEALAVVGQYKITIYLWTLIP